MTKTNFADIVFNEADHSYTLNGQPLVSVTSIISRLKPKFDAPAVAARVSEREGGVRSVGDILAGWEQKRKSGLERGTHVHTYISARILTSNDLTPYDPTAEYHLSAPPRYFEMNAFDQWWWNEAIERTGHGVVEWIVGDAGLGIAGTVDAMLWSDDHRGNVIFDWKTGQKYNTENRWQTLLPPFDDLPNCEHTIYSLQTSLYRLIVERNHGPVADCHILHLSPDGRHTLHRAIDLRDRLLAWLTESQSQLQAEAA